ncbi:hypothetical protein RBY4I_1662 [Rhodobacterales bacterium Y4I]|nr:hypothetical protein RBY4I_1662 [Rhodobacterales bacterium Y4I]
MGQGCGGLAPLPQEAPPGRKIDRSAFLPQCFARETIGQTR